MICKGCGGDYEKDKIICPYCGRVNDEGMEQANHNILQGQVPISNAKQNTINTTGVKQTTVTVNSRSENKGLKRVTIVSCICLLLASLAFMRAGINSRNNNNKNTGELMTSKNIERITEAIDRQDYLEALMIAMAIRDKEEYDFTSFGSELSEELTMIESYYDITNSTVEYFLEERAIDEYMLNAYKVKYSKDIYNALVTTKHSQQVKQDLSKKLDVYLKYYYCLTDNELQELKDMKNGYDFTIQGEEDFSEILIERMELYYE